MPDASLELRLPSPDDGTVKAEIVEWLVAVGDRVEPGQMVCTVETDKTVVDLACPFAGTVASLGAAEGEVLEVGAILMTATPDPDPEPVPEAASPPAAGDEAGGLSEQVSPLVRRLAEEFGVDLSQLRGTGPYGRITRADVQRAAFGTVIGESPEAAPAPEPPAPPAPSARVAGTTDEAGAGTADELAADRPAGTNPAAPDRVHGTADELAADRPTGSISQAAGAPAVQPAARAAILEVGEAAATAATEPGPGGAVTVITLYREVAAERLLAAHHDLDGATGGLPLAALLVRLVATALAEHPRLNSRVGGDGRLHPSDSVDLAVSCPGDQGLSFPVVRQANERSLRLLGRTLADLGTRARHGRLQPGETGGQSFTLHDLGPLGVTSGTTALPAGTAGLVSVGHPRPTVRMVAGAPREVPVITVGLTVDHRVIDDAEAARFLADLARYLEAPILAFID